MSDLDMNGGRSLGMMTAFEHVTALSRSFTPWGGALTHLLARIAKLIVARDRVRFPDAALGMITLFFVFANWLSLGIMRSPLEPCFHQRSVVFAINVFLICVLSDPKLTITGRLIEDFFWRQRPYLWRSRGLRRFVIVAN